MKGSPVRVRASALGACRSLVGGIGCSVPTTDKRAVTAAQARLRTSALVSLAATVVGAALLVVGPADGAGPRFRGWLGENPKRPVRTWSGGGIYSLYFVDRAGSGTRYRVCIGAPGKPPTSCRKGRTGPRGTIDAIAVNTVPAMEFPRFAKEVVARWFVGGRQVATWTFNLGYEGEPGP